MGALAPATIAIALGFALELGALDLIARAGKKRLLGWLLALALAGGAAGGALGLYGKDVQGWLASQQQHRVEQSVDYASLIAQEEKNLTAARENSPTRAGWLGEINRATERIQTLEQARAKAQSQAPAFPLELAVLLGAALLAMCTIQLLTAEAAQELSRSLWQKQPRLNPATHQQAKHPTQTVQVLPSTRHQRVAAVQQKMRARMQRIGSWAKLAGQLGVNKSDLSLL